MLVSSRNRSSLPWFVGWRVPGRRMPRPKLRHVRNHSILCGDCHDRTTTTWFDHVWSLKSWWDMINNSWSANRSSHFDGFRAKPTWVDCLDPRSETVLPCRQVWFAKRTPTLDLQYLNRRCNVDYIVNLQMLEKLGSRCTRPHSDQTVRHLQTPLTPPKKDR